MVTPPSKPIRELNLGKIGKANENSALPVVNFPPPTVQALSFSVPHGMEKCVSLFRTFIVAGK